MKKKYFVLILIPIIIFVGKAVQSATLTLKECLQRAQQNSYLLKASEYQAEATERNFQFERSRNLPQISGELSHEQRYLAAYNFHQQWLLVHSDWSLGDFLLKTAGAARQDALMMKAQQEQIRLDVARRAALLYVNILQRQTQSDLLEKRLELLRAHHDVAHALWQAGTRTQFDVLQTESEMSLLQEQLAALDIEREVSWQELAHLMNWKNSEFPRFSPLDAAEICAQPLLPVNESLITSNPLVQALSFQIKAEQIRKKGVTAQQLPTVHVAGGRFVDADPAGDGDYWQVDAGIDLPLFQWSATKFQRQESQAIIHSLQAQKMDVQRELTIQIQQALQKLERLKNVLALQSNRLSTNEKAFQFAEANYQAGLITNLDYLSAQQQLTETQLAIEETQLEYVVNLIEFYIATNQVEQVTEIE
jgi:outer membrane protein TolC